MEKALKRSIYTALSVAIIGMGIYRGLFNHKPFIDFVFEFGDVVNQNDFMPEHSGINYDIVMPAKSELSVPSELLQPSGISISDHGMLVVGDTADVFWLELDGYEKASIQLEESPLLLRQGLYEGVTWVDQGIAAVIGHEGTSLTLLELNSNRIRVVKTLELKQPTIPQTELQALAFNKTDGQLNALHVDQDGLIRSVSISLDGLVSSHDVIDTTILGGRLGEILGAAWWNNTLFALTNNNLILSIEDNVVTNVWALDYAADTSGLAVYAGALYVVTDHEYYQMQPPIKVFDLPNQPNRNQS